jgi:hypothetical protein
MVEFVDDLRSNLHIDRKIYSIIFGNARHDKGGLMVKEQINLDVAYDHIQ